MNQEQCTDLIEHYLAAYNAFDVDAMVALLTPGVRFENVAGGRINAEADGIDAFRALAEQGRQLFAEREQRIRGLEFDGRRAIVAIDWRGRFAIDIPDGPRAGSELALQGRSEFEFDDGRIARIIDIS